MGQQTGSIDQTDGPVVVYVLESPRARQTVRHLALAGVRAKVFADPAAGERWAAAECAFLLEARQWRRLRPASR